MQTYHYTTSIEHTGFKNYIKGIYSQAVLWKNTRLWLMCHSDVERRLLYAFFVRYGQLVPAPCSSLGKYSSPVFCSHSGSKAVLVYSFSF
jgi:hypothetical protein